MSTTDKLRALVADEACYVLGSTDIFCTGLIGGTFPGGGTFTEDMCCLPCRLRAILDAEQHETADLCGLCKRPATGLAGINGIRYCHGDEDATPTCYEVVGWRESGDHRDLYAVYGAPSVSPGESEPWRCPATGPHEPHDWRITPESSRRCAGVVETPEGQPEGNERGCRLRSASRGFAARWECITWPGMPSAYPCGHDHSHCDAIGCVEHIGGMHVDSLGDAIVHVGCDDCAAPAPVPDDEAVEALTAKLHADPKLGPSYMLLGDCEHLARRVLALGYVSPEAHTAAVRDAVRAHGERIAEAVYELAVTRTQALDRGWYSVARKDVLRVIREAVQ